RLLGFAGGAVVSIILDARLRETKPRAQAGDEAIALGELVEMVNDAAVHEAEDPGVGGAGEVGEAAENGVEELEPQRAHAVLGAAGSFAEHDGIAGFPFRD